MKNHHYLKGIAFLAVLFILSACSQKVEWVSTTESQPWAVNEVLKIQKSTAAGDVVIDINQTEQTIEGFGACFNELGWTSLKPVERRGSAADFC